VRDLAKFGQKYWPDFAPVAVMSSLCPFAFFPFRFLPVFFFSSLSLFLTLTVHSQTMGKDKATVAEKQLQGDFALPPSSGPATLDSSDWPLLLKNFHRLNVRSSHFTPLPSGKQPIGLILESSRPE
jgi:hypothetical protein